MNVGLLVAFVAISTISVWLQQRLYRAVQGREPQQYEPDSAWVERAQEQPSSVIRETIGATRAHLAVLVRPSPDPEVELLRWITIIAEGLSIASFVLVLLT